MSISKRSASFDTLTEEYPLDERLCGQRMLAAYRPTGRSACAFQQLRHNLAQELGLEPGPELVELERGCSIMIRRSAPVPRPRSRRVSCEPPPSRSRS